MKKSIIYAVFILLITSYSFGQVTGEEPPVFDEDSVMVFNSPRPLISPQVKGLLKNAWGIDILFSNSGFGAGVFLERELADNLHGFASLYLSGLRISDEIELQDPLTGEFFVPNKIYDLYTIPIMVGLRYNLFSGILFESFRPYVSFGLGPNFIVAAPYELPFFESFSEADFHTRFGGFLGIGAKFGSSTKSLNGISIRYYYVPFGGDGIESIRGNPIHNVGGGIYISLSLGTRY